MGRKLQLTVMSSEIITEFPAILVELKKNRREKRERESEPGRKLPLKLETLIRVTRKAWPLLAISGAFAAMRRTHSCYRSPPSHSVSYSHVRRKPSTLYGQGRSPMGPPLPTTPRADFCNLHSV